MQVYIITEGIYEDTAVLGTASNLERAHELARDGITSMHERDIWGPYDVDGPLTTRYQNDKHVAGYRMAWDGIIQSNA